MAVQVKAAARGLPTDLRLALRELEALRRERDALAARLGNTEAQVQVQVQVEAPPVRPPIAQGHPVRQIAQLARHSSGTPLEASQLGCVSSVHCLSQFWVVAPAAALRLCAGAEAAGGAA